MLKRFIYLLPTLTIILAVFKIMFCTGNEFFCIPWPVLFLPVTIYGMYFLYGLIKSVNQVLKAVKDEDDIDITFR